MKINAKYKILINVYILITIISFFLFLLILITIPEINILFIQFIFTIWFFDTFSYLGGKLFGKKKLMPAISSGKTINGLIIGFVFSLFFSQILKYYLFTYSITFIFETILIVFLAFIGDMTVSILKRNSGIKDSGNIMPGHGGLLDRFDSFILVFLVIGLTYTI